MGPMESRNKLLQIAKAKLVELGYSESDLEYVSVDRKLAICMSPKNEADFEKLAAVSLALRITILNSLIEHKMRVTGTPVSAGWYLITWEYKDIVGENEKSS